MALFSSTSLRAAFFFSGLDIQTPKNINLNEYFKIVVKMPEWEIRVYCPYDLQQFLVPITAPTKDEAKKGIIGKSLICPSAHDFEVEDIFIMGVYPSSRVTLPPYKVAPLNSAKPPKWSFGATVVEDKPLPIGSEPVGKAHLKQAIRDDLTTLVFEQEVESKAILFRQRYSEFTIGEIKYGPYNAGDIDIIPSKKAKELIDMGIAEWAYPEHKFHIQFTRDFFTKFLDEAKRIRDTGKIEDAIIYLVNHSPGVTIPQIADMLGIGLFTAYRKVAELSYVSPTYKLKNGKWLREEFIKEVDETSTLDHWTSPQSEEVKSTMTKPKEIKFHVGAPWRGNITVYPLKRKTEEELLEEAKRILTLQGYRLTVEEENKMKEAMKKQTEAWIKQSIVSYLEES